MELGPLNYCTDSVQVANSHCNEIKLRRKIMKLHLLGFLAATCILPSTAFAQSNPFPNCDAEEVEILMQLLKAGKWTFAEIKNHCATPGNSNLTNTQSSQCGWVLAGRGDIPFHRKGNPSSGSGPVASYCQPNVKISAVCWSAGVNPNGAPGAGAWCTYKDVHASKVLEGKGKHPGNVFQCNC